MSTCKDCLHYDVCGGFTPTDLDVDVFDYCRKGNTDEIPDIDERCGSFKNKADYVEVRHGKWIYVETDENDMAIIKCSECNTKRYGTQKYCGKCGAKMDGRKESEVQGE